MTRKRVRTEPRWPALLALLAVGGLRLALPGALAVGPNWLLLGVVGLLSIPLLWLRRGGIHHWNQWLGSFLLALVTVDMLWSLGRLIHAVIAHSESPVAMLCSAAALWVTNILVFASWYWRLDAGGPHARELRDAHTGGAFLFPQMTLDPRLRAATGAEDWRPGFVDYLFLAFNSSTAFSPTDAPVLSRWAKATMMLQALVSLSTVTLLAARAINIL